ncbi:MAG: hypothetical protein D6808_05160 [Candidatus Dadabacteria bacterium]|nr:MAG: hypothetical protein D6808_05160 [Candidatus Dadabacteria bacterium]
MGRYSSKSTCILSAVFVLWGVAAFGLPFNDDMVNMSALRPGTVAREIPEGSVPMGSLKLAIPSKEKLLSAKNPRADEPYSAIYGKRLYTVHCKSCHGEFTTNGYKPGGSARRARMPGPDLSNEYYSSKPEGFFFATINHGGLAIMPKIGWKLSADEAWDIVSYLRKVQREAAQKRKNGE